ncbi:hypothetical protein [Ralstonia phage phiITL-1]|uniref:Uncharacterized protein n=1 Tax=Ralstonia phage phiITL-1 TaxID=1597967 RepID=A0A0U1ZH61_9CAUD|nr:hypothetical protein HOR02_gp34 [Ralstonia phage phiITL-1]AJT60818.1 hypothetical protein [Ralstonia phage phiITL-1]
MSIELRRRNNGAAVVMVPDSRNTACERNQNGNRKAIATFTPPYNRSRVEKYMGKVVLVTPALLQQALAEKRVALDHDPRRFLKARAALSNAWARVKEVFRGN